MISKTISEAKAELSAPVEVVQKGEEVLIGEAGKPVACLVAYAGAAKPRVPGPLAGKIRIGDDFDAPLPEEIAVAFGATGSSASSRGARRKPGKAKR